MSEFVLGTDPVRRDTDGDGVSDLAEIQQGSDPLSGRAVTTGILAALQLPGTAKEVVLEGTGDQQQTAYVALGSRGLGIVNASQFRMPILFGQLDLPGDSTDVAVDSNLKIAVIAANADGLHLVNVSDPMLLARLHTFNIAASQVEVLDGIAYVASGTQIISYDLANAERLQSLTVSAAILTGLAREGSFLYTMDSGFRLRVIEIIGANMVARGSLTLSRGGGKLFVGNGVAYVAAEDGPNGGFATVNVANADNPVLLSGVDANNVAGRMVVANGSGLALTVGNPGGLANTLDVLNVSDPANTGVFVTGFNLSAPPFSVAIGAGIAFVAGGTAGLQVVNYKSFDNQGTAPTVTITALPTDLDAVMPGIQVQDGSFIRLGAQISDDVQVRNVELLVNGQVVRNDVAFPFDLEAAMPPLAGGITNVELRVRATDTGGNIGLSAPVLVQLVPDTFPPAVFSINPPNGAIRGQNFRAVTVRFSEPLDPASISAASVALNGPGGVIAPQSIQFANNGATVQLLYATLTPDAYQITLYPATIRDRAGNTIGGSVITNAFQILEVTAIWSNPNGGFWDDAANWDGTLPGANDDVLIDVPGDVTITYRQGATAIRSLRTKNPFVLSGGTLTVSNVFEIDSTFTLNGGTLARATVVTGPTGRPLVFFPNTANRMDGVTVNGEMDLVNGNVTVVNGLTLNGTAYMGDQADLGSAAYVRFEGSQTLSGNGVVVFGQHPCNALWLGNGETLTIGSNMVVRGHTGKVGTAPALCFSLSAATDTRVINQGTIAADLAGGIITVNASVFSNIGTTNQLNGGRLIISPQ